MSKSRAKKMLQLLNIQKEQELDETDNPDSVLFANNQFPKPYDCLVGHDSLAYKSASSSLFDNSIRDCIENEQPGMEDTYNSLSFKNNLFDNNKYFNTETYEIVDNFIIEDIFPLGTEHRSPSLLSPGRTSPFNFNTDSACNTYEPMNGCPSNNEPMNACPSNSNDSLLNDDLPLEEQTVHETIPQIPTASDLMTKLVDYNDSDSGPDEPVIKRKKRCQVKKEEWLSEINKKNREKGKEYCGKKS